MQIGGNGSCASELRWFVDRTDGVLPRAWVLSLPLWAYRAVMLLWALWLAQALLRWLRWGYGAFTAGGLWRRKPPAPPVVTAPPAATPPSITASGPAL